MSRGDLALEKVMKLEMALLFLINALRNGAVPDERVLDQIEHLVTSGGAQKR